MCPHSGPGWRRREGGDGLCCAEEGDLDGEEDGEDDAGLGPGEVEGFGLVVEQEVGVWRVGVGVGCGD